MELLLNFIDFEIIIYCLASCFGVGIGYISLEKGNSFSKKTKFFVAKKVSLSEIFKKKNLKIILFWLSYGGILGLMMGLIKGMIQASAQVYSVQGANLPEWVASFMAFFFVVGVSIISSYAFPRLPHQKKLKDLSSRVEDLEKSSSKTG